MLERTLFSALIGWSALGSLASAQVAPAAPAAAATTATAHLELPGGGLAGRDFLYAGEWDTRKPVQTAYIVKGGKVVWSFTIPSSKGEISDCSLLSNGNVIMAHQHGALVVTPDKQVIWSYACPAGTEVHTIQALGFDKVMIFSNGNPAKVMTYDIKTNTMEKSFEVAVGNPKSTHGQVRHMRITPQGTLLIAHMDSKEVCEYDMDGKKLSTLKLPGGVWDAVRLKNGNLLVTTQKTHIQELDKDGKVVWELQPSDLPGIPIHNIQEASRLDNGDTVFTNWIPNSAKAPQWPGTLQALEVTPEKKPVWGLSEWADPDLGPATCLQILGQSGTPEDHTMQR